MLTAKGTFKITGWLGGMPRFYTHKGVNGEFETASISLGVSKRIKDRDGNWKSGEIKNYYISLSGKSVAYIKSDVEAGLWKSGDLIEAEGDLDCIPAPDASKDADGHSKGYSRIVLHAYNVSNIFAYVRHKEKQKEERGEEKQHYKQPVGDAVMEPHSDVSLEDFPFGQNAESEIRL